MTTESYRGWAQDPLPPLEENAVNSFRGLIQKLGSLFRYSSHVQLIFSNLNIVYI